MIPASSVPRAVPALTQVPVAPASPERFRALVGEDYAAVEQATRTAEQLLAGRVIWHVNSTARGGGVAEMLHSLLAYARGAGVDVRWLTIGGNPDFFASPSGSTTSCMGPTATAGTRAGGRKIYESTLLEAAVSSSSSSRGDIVYIHDPQPAGLIPHVRARAPRSSGAVTSASIAPTNWRDRPGTSCGPTSTRPMPWCSPAGSSSGRDSNRSGSGWCRPRSTPSLPRTRARPAGGPLDPQRDRAGEERPLPRRSSSARTAHGARRSRGRLDQEGPIPDDVR